MKSIFLTLLALLITTYSSQSFAQRPKQSIEEYNEGIGIQPEFLNLVCSYVQGRGENYKNWGVSPLEEIIYQIENIDYGAYEDKSIPQKMFSKLWAEKYSKCYCPDDPNSEVEGHLDVIAFYVGETSFIDALYSPKGVYQADINRELYEAYYSGVKGTYLDLLYRFGIERPITSVKASKNKQDYYKTMIQFYRDKYGAKRLSELDK